LSTAFISAPFSTKILTDSFCPLIAAAIKAEIPALDLWLIAAPFDNKYSNICVFPNAAILINAVSPNLSSEFIFAPLSTNNFTVAVPSILAMPLT